MFRSEQFRCETNGYFHKKLFSKDIETFLQTSGKAMSFSQENGKMIETERVRSPISENRQFLGKEDTIYQKP